MIKFLLFKTTEALVAVCNWDDCKSKQIQIISKIIRRQYLFFLLTNQAEPK